MKNLSKYWRAEIADKIGFTNKGDQYLRALYKMFNLPKHKFFKNKSRKKSQ